MKVTITEFDGPAQGLRHGNALPLGGNRVGGGTMTAPGAYALAGVGTRLVRVATDTDVTINGYAAGSAEFMPAGSVEWFPVWGRASLVLS